MSSQNHLPPAFSLVELLVVVAIIGALTALLLPALSRSKGRASEARCASNLKQIYAGFLMYHSDTSHFPGKIVRQGKAWSSATFFGGNGGSDSNAPPEDIRPLNSYLTKGEVFRCLADVGVGTNKWGVSLEPSLFAVWGLSYWYHAGPDRERFPHSTDGLADRKMEWVQRPSAYVLAAEPPAVVTVYWHRARRPGSGDNYADDERGPRVSPFLFVDGHVKFYDCSHQYTHTPRFPGEVEFEQ